MIEYYYNGNIYAGRGRFVSSFAVENGVIIAVGEETAELDLSAVKRFDLAGEFLCAGFNDSHMHLLNYGQILNQAPLYEHTSSLEDVLDCLKTQLYEHPPKEGEWLCGRGWNQDLFKGNKRMPSRYDLDEVSSEIPIMITRACGHCCVLNSKALELCGITDDTPQPEGGSIGMENGVPDGRLFDNAMEPALERMPLPTDERIKEMIRSACKKLNAYGITSVQTDDYCVFREIEPAVINRAYRELEEAGELTVRVCEQCNLLGVDQLISFMNDCGKTGEGDFFFKIGPLKLLGDGALGSRTAHLTKPYLGTGEYGFSLFSKEHMAELIDCANSNGMQCAVHAIGDACLDEVLDAYESALTKHPKKDHRHGIVHCQVTRSDQLDRIARLGLHVYAQSVFLDFDNHIVEKLVDPETAKTSYNWKTLMDMGVTVSNGSDCPVELPDVMKGIECAVTRTSLDGTGPYIPEQSFTVAEALDSFTVNGAIASFEEEHKGLIEKGHAADFVILDGDPFICEKTTLHEIEIKATYLGGKCVYEH